MGTENNEWWNEPHVVPLKSGELYSTNYLHWWKNLFFYFTTSSTTFHHLPPPSPRGWARGALSLGMVLPFLSLRPPSLESHVAAKDYFTNAMMTIKKCL
jgi:hypothetical protein